MAVNFVHQYAGRENVDRRIQVEPRPLSETGLRPEKPGFGELVKDFARDVNRLQLQSGDAVNRLATGQAVDVHQVMIAASQAGIALDLMLEIRNRVLEGYQELSRMQV